MPWPPPPKLFLDDRLDIYGEEVVEDYTRIVTIDKEVDNLLESYGIDWVLFPPSPFTCYLKASKGWVEIYGDEQILILTRTVAI